MNCENTRPYLSEYLDDRLEETVRRRIAAHLDACPACRVELEELQKVIDIVGGLPFLTAPPTLQEKILADNLRKVPGREGVFAMPRASSRWMPLLRGVAAAAVIFLFAYVGLQVVHDDEAPETWKTAPRLETEVGGDSLPEPGRDEHANALGALERDQRRLQDRKTFGKNAERLEKDSQAAEKDGALAERKPKEEKAEGGRRTEDEKPASDAPRAKQDDLLDAEGGEHPSGQDKGTAGGPGLGGLPPEPRRAEPSGAEDEEAAAEKLRRLAERSKELQGGSPSAEGEPATKGKTTLRGGASRGADATLLVTTGDAAKERERILAAFASLERGETKFRKAAQESRDDEPAPSEAMDAGARTEEVKAEREEAEGAEKEVSGRPAEAPESGYAPGAPPAASPEENGEAARRRSRSAGTVQILLPKDENGGMVFLFTLESYRKFKEILGDGPTRFHEEPSERLLKIQTGVSGKPRAPREPDADAADDDGKTEDALKGTSKKTGPTEPTWIRVRIRFEPLEATPAPLPSTDPAGAPAEPAGGASREAAGEDD